MLGIAQGLLRLLRTKPHTKETTVSCTQLVVMYAPFKFGSEHNFLGMVWQVKVISGAICGKKMDHFYCISRSKINKTDYIMLWGKTVTETGSCFCAGVYHLVSGHSGHLKDVSLFEKGRAITQGVVVPS